MKKLSAAISLIFLTWIFQGGSFAAAVTSTATSTSTATVKPPPPIAGEPGPPDPEHPGICITKFDQRYPCKDIPPPPPSAPGVQAAIAPQDNRADGWDANKYNANLYDQIAAGDEYGKMTQGSALSQYDKVLLLCVRHNVDGRPDDLCTISPNHPECTGLKTSMQNATNCNIPPPPGAPAGAACKGYGAYGYVIDEWLVFGEQYYNGMGGCLTAKEGTNKAAERASRLINITDMVQSPAGLGGTFEDSSGASTITGKIKKIDLSQISQQLANEMDDGAETLGYERGEFFTQALKGKSFSNVFNDSPFAGKLGRAYKESIENALANSGETRTKVKDKRLADAEKIKDKKTAAGESTIAIENAIAKVGSDKSEDALTALEKSARGPASASAAKGQGGKIQSNTSPGMAMSWAEKNKGWLNQNAGTSENRSEPAKDAPASELVSLGGLEGDPEVSLFKRISLSYRRIAPAMGAYGESKTAREVRLTDTPQFFKDL